MSKDTVAVLALVVASFSALGTILNLSVSAATYFRVRPRVKLKPWFHWGNTRKTQAGTLVITLGIENKGQHPVTLSEGIYLFIQDAADIPKWTWIFNPRKRSDYFHRDDMQSLAMRSPESYEVFKPQLEESEKTVPAFGGIEWNHMIDGDMLPLPTEPGRSYCIRFMVRQSTGKTAFSAWNDLVVPAKAMTYLMKLNSSGAGADVLKPFLDEE
ncbi:MULTISPECIES: hypothetical protein [unclassified Streptomyces]|uniref:hypothetical protein n=1 Tax=unclassified Streptomyces TaxID=2593676 RepID=UPI002E297857|nr:hypothetical protein [Streptomyces sp. NBC_00228]